MDEATAQDRPSQALRPALLLGVIGHALGVWLMIMLHDGLFLFAGLMLPVVTAFFFGPLLHWPHEWLIRVRLSKPLEGTLPRLYLSRHGTLLRGHGVGLILIASLGAVMGYVEAETLWVALSFALGVVGLFEAGLAHAHTASELRRALRPWRTLRALMDLPDLSSARDAAVLWEELQALPDPSGEAVRHGQIWLEQMRHRSLKQVQAMAKEGRGKEASLEMDRWPSVRDDVTALMEFLQLGPEPLEEIREEVLHASDLHWMHECSAAESLIEEATTLEDKSEGSAALEKLDLALTHLPEVPGAPVQDLRERIFAMQRLINERLIEAHRAAEAAADAVKEPVEHPYTDTPQPHRSPSQRSEQRVDHQAKTEEALSHARQFLTMHDHRSAHGWLLHAEHHAAQVVSVQGVALREQVAEVRERCEIKPEAPLPSEEKALEEEAEAKTRPIDPEKVMAEYMAKHGVVQEEQVPKSNAGIMNALVLLGGAMFFLGFFFVPWQRNWRSVGLMNGTELFDLPGQVAEQMSRGLISRGMIAYLELIAVALLCFGVLVVTVVAVVRINGNVPKKLDRNALISLVIGLFAGCFLWMVTLTNQSAIAWNIIRGHEEVSDLYASSGALPPTGQSFQMLALVFQSAGLGLWFIFISVLLVCVGAFSRLRSS